MKKFLLLVLLLPSLAWTQVPAYLIPNPLGVLITIGQWIYSSDSAVRVVVVQGQGLDQPTARANGFRLAVESSIGSVVASESRVVNGQLTESIINYSSGSVERFEILEQTDTTVTMRVWVRRMRIADRLLASSTTEQFGNTAAAAVRLNTQLEERATADRLLGQVLQDFPARAFQNRIHKTDLILDTRRQTVLRVRFTTEWDSRYLASLAAVRQSAPEDAVSRARILDRMIDTRPTVRLQVQDSQGHTTKSSCLGYAELDHQIVERPNRYFVSWTAAAISYNAVTLSGHLELPLTQAQAQDISRVQLSIVPYSECL